MWTSPSKHSWRKRKTSEYRDSRWREDTRNIEQWRKETVLSAERRIQELREGQRILKKDDQISQSSESSRNSFPRSTETSVKESTRSQRYEGRNYKDLREIIRKKRQGRENVGSSKGSGLPDVKRTHFDNKQVTGLQVLNEDEHHMEVTKEDIQPASNTVDEDELELTISEKDIFPELRDQERSKATKTRSMKTKLTSSSGLDNFEKVDTKGPEVDCDSSGNVQRILGNEKHDLLQVPASAPSTLERVTVSSGQMINLDKDGIEPVLTTSAGSLNDRRDKTMLDVELEVYTHRLKELEDERERLRLRVLRVGLEEQERAGQKRILKLFYARDCLRDKVNIMLENENKENKG